MKKLYLFVVSLIFIIGNSSIAQNITTETSGRWRLGINGGATWQSGDVKAKAGFAGGFNIEKILNKRDDTPIGASLGLRMFWGNN